MVDKDELESDLDGFFTGDYSITQGNTKPRVSDISFGKTGRELELAMLFVDIKESTKIVDGFRRITAAKMYKSFLSGVTKIVRANDGELCSFNGDGVLIAFNGDYKCTNAAKSALHLKWYVDKVMQPKLQSYFDRNQQLADMNFDCGIGVDVGEVLVVRGGIKGENNNDLVWVGNATNYAVKLSDLSNNGYSIHISNEVHNRLSNSSKMANNSSGTLVDMWSSWYSSDLSMYTYRSNWIWSL